MIAPKRWFGVRVPMRDGVGLATDIHFPEAGPDEMAYPAIVMRTPYGKGRFGSSAELYRSHGYVVVAQDVRGRHDSDGEWRPIFNEGRDGYDTIEWTAAQSWCDGNVGTAGGSYPGWVQWAAARERPPHLKAMCVDVTAGWWGHQEMYDCGCFTLGTLAWMVLVSDRVLQDNARIDWRDAFLHLPVSDTGSRMRRELPHWGEWLEHPSLDDYWKQVLWTAEDFAQADIPVLHVSGWYDLNKRATVFFYRGMVEHSKARNRQALILGPWDHGAAGMLEPPLNIGGETFPPQAYQPLGEYRVRWFDRWLKGRAVEIVTGSHTYATGADSWREDREWPAAAMRTLHFGDGALVDEPVAGAGSRCYSYDPADPVTLFRNWDIYGWVTDPSVPPPDMTRERAPLLNRPDVLAFTGAPLADPLEISGLGDVYLHASTDGPDTDWFCWLVDVEPDGRAREIASGQLRGRYRESLEKPVLLEPGRVYEFRVELTPAAHLFRAGHRIQLLVSSSNFPVYDRNLNTGEPNGTSTRMRVALNTVHFGGGHASRIELPVR